MKNLYLLLTALVFCSCDCNQAINRHKYEYQPDIVVGGRIVTINKSPTKDSDILAASESGGVFVSRNFGKSWEHLNLPVFEMFDAKFSQTDPNVMIATCIKDLKVKNGGGIWRSADGGKSWSKPPSSILTGFFAKPESNGYAIAIEPGTSKIYVGTENGIAISNDNGVNWTFNGLNGFGVALTVYSILAPGGRSVLATTEDGLYKSIDGGSTWTRTFENYNLALTRALCTSPSNKQNVFLAAGDYKIYFSNDFGSTWREINSPGGRNREPFIRCSTYPADFFGQTINVTYLYFGDGVDLWRKILPNAEISNIDFGNGWDRVTVDHSDPSDMIFSTDGKPLLLSGDGGLFSSDDNGNSFHFIGGGNHGLNALQVNEVTAQTNYDDIVRDLIYFGTQDNYFWWSEDGGKTWGGAWGSEGHSIETKRKMIGKKGNLMTVQDNGAGKAFVFDYKFQNQQDWKPPTTKPVNNPVIVIEGDILDPDPRNRFIQLTNAAVDTNPVSNFYNTYDGGQNWNLKGSMTFNTSTGDPQVSTLNGSPVVYQAISLPGTTPQGMGKIGLVRMSQLNGTGPGLLERADINNFGSLGIFPTMFKWYDVFGVRPGNPNHIIIPDVEDSCMKVSWDGGKNWFKDDELTDLVTSSGTFEFYEKIDCCPRIIVNCIAYNPQDSNQIAVGTRENGLFMSWDKGENWFPVNDTRRITNPSKIFFYFDNSLLVSSYGRGLWKFNPVRGEKPSGRYVPKGVYIFEHYKKLAKRLEENFPGAGENNNSRIIIFNDSLLKIDIRSLRSGSSEPLRVRNVSIWDLNRRFINDSDNFELRLPLISENEIPEFDPLIIRGVIVNQKNETEGLIISKEPYKLFTIEESVVKELTEPYIELRNSKDIYTYSVNKDEAYRLKGYHFSPSQEVRIFINDSLKYTLPVSKNGTFETEIYPGREIKGYRFQIDVEGIYRKEKVRRTLLLQVLRSGDEFGKRMINNE